MSLFHVLRSSCAAAWIAACAVPMAAQAQPVPAVSASFQQAGYANFLNNWNDVRYPVFYGLVQSLDEYKQIFSAAATMGNTLPYFPEAAVFDDAQILVVSRVLNAAPAGQSWFSMEGLQQQGNALHVHYRVQHPGSGASYQTKDGLEIQIPRKAYDTIVFIENGTEVGRLDVKNGQRLVTDPGR